MNIPKECWLSHILVCCSPGHTFDISYVHLLKLLDNLCNKIHSAVAELLKTVPVIPREWVNQRRPCAPRVLFLFMSCPSALRGSRGLKDERRDAKPHKHPPIKRLEFSLEDQIYRILRKAHITNVASDSLFAVSSNQEFVFVETGSQGTAMDSQAALINNCFSMMGSGDTHMDSGGSSLQLMFGRGEQVKQMFQLFLEGSHKCGF